MTRVRPKHRLLQPALRIAFCLLPLALAYSASPQAPQAVDGSDLIHPTKDPKSQYGVYVPKDLEDAFVELKKMLPPKALEEMRTGSEAGMARYHLAFGMWLRNNWGLWGGSRLSKYFNKLGIHHPDDMSGLILTTFWRHLNEKPLRISEEVAHYKQYWEAMARQEKKGK